MAPTIKLIGHCREQLNIRVQYNRVAQTKFWIANLEKGIIIFLLCFPPSRLKELLTTQKGWITIRDDTWNVLSMQRITSNSKRWDYLDIPGGVT